MAVVLLFFWRVCLLRLSPEIAPKHPFIAMMVLAANLSFSVVASSLITGEPALKLATGVFVSTAVSLGLIRFFCHLRGVGDRFMRTIITWLGCDLVLTAIFAVTAGISALLEVVGGGGVLGLLFAMWSVTVLGFILSKALNLHRVLGVGIAFTIMLVSAGLGLLASGG